MIVLLPNITCLVSGDKGDRSQITGNPTIPYSRLKERWKVPILVLSILFDLLLSQRSSSMFLEISSAPPIILIP